MWFNSSLYKRKTSLQLFSFFTGIILVFDTLAKKAAVLYRRLPAGETADCLPLTSSPVSVLQPLAAIPSLGARRPLLGTNISHNWVPCWKDWSPGGGRLSPPGLFSQREIKKHCLLFALFPFHYSAGRCYYLLWLRVTPAASTVDSS